jgi:hypothetical protein
LEGGKASLASGGESVKSAYELVSATDMSMISRNTPYNPCYPVILLSRTRFRPAAIPPIAMNRPAKLLLSMHTLLNSVLAAHPGYLAQLAVARQIASSGHKEWRAGTPRFSAAPDSWFQHH